MSDSDSSPRATGAESGATRPAPQVLGVNLQSNGTELDPNLAQAAAQADRVLSSGHGKLLKKRLAEITAGLEPAARIFCSGPVRVPEVGELRFEPVIITPTRFVWRRLIFVPLAVFILAFWLAQVTQLIRLPFRVPLGSFGYVLTMGAMGLIMWIWRTTVQPAYIRLAPGIIQVLQYWLRASKPVIRSYPMQPGTLVVVRQGKRGRRPHSVQLMRGEQGDVLPVSQMKNADEAMGQIWQALLSTAPTPPLSEDELVG